ncbi:MAG: nucleotidyltransferase domain-containing protein [Flavisolibacter sp.]
MCVKHDILATLSYFDLFDYPLTQTEIVQFSKTTYPQEEFIAGLQNLVMENWVFRYDDFYLLRDDYSLVQRRRKGNLKAKTMLKTAEGIAGFLSCFPFVKGVAVSGSLSKNYADDQSDIDFFVITEKDKLWLSRTFMHVFKKMAFLLKKQDLFCMNYYISEEALEIKEKNLYTATEVCTLLPLRGIGVFQQFFKENTWSKNFLPNHSLRVSYVQQAENPLPKRLVEWALRNRIGNVLDWLLMRISIKRWERKTRSYKMNKHGSVMKLDASRHYAKPDPIVFQQKLIELYQKKIFNLFCRYETKAKTVF